MSDDLIQVGVRVRREQWEKVHALAKAKGISVSEVVRRLIDRLER